ncbi:MAG: hypothetical protein ABFD90_02125 [Phycisphaerales bacterium]
MVGSPDYGLFVHITDRHPGGVYQRPPRAKNNNANDQVTRNVNPMNTTVFLMCLFTG